MDVVVVSIHNKDAFVINYLRPVKKERSFVDTSLYYYHNFTFMSKTENYSIRFILIFWQYDEANYTLR